MSTETTSPEPVVIARAWEDAALVWTTDGDVFTGRLADYARHIESAHYHGLEVSPLYEVQAWSDNTLHLQEARIERTITEGPDFQHVVLSHGDQDAAYRIDLRA